MILMRWTHIRMRAAKILIGQEQILMRMKINSHADENKFSCGRKFIPVGQDEFLMGQDEFLAGLDKVPAGRKQSYMGRKQSHMRQENILIGEEKILLADKKIYLVVDDSLSRR